MLHRSRPARAARELTAIAGTCANAAMRKPAVVIRSEPHRRQWWKETLGGLLPEFGVFLLEEDERAYEPRDVEYVVAWNPPLGMFARFPNLKGVLSIGAGVSHILKDPHYPRGVPLIRTVGEPFRVRMAEYVTLHVLRHHRRLADVQAAHRQCAWTQHLTPLASETTVGVMGLGALGSAAARALAALRYRVHGWSRTGRPLDGVRVFAGPEQLQAFLCEVAILVVLLPHTPDTENILCARTLSMLQDGACLINAGRGECVNDDDLLAALDSGKLSAATLDVFRQEPLPALHPFWQHPKILVTCHTAAAVDPRVGGRIIANNLRAAARGEQLPDLVNLERGY